MGNPVVYVHNERIKGHDAFMPACKISKGIILLTYRRKSFSLEQVIKLRSVGFDVVYSGAPSIPMDELGFEYTGPEFDENNEGGRCVFKRVLKKDTTKPEKKVAKRF